MKAIAAFERVQYRALRRRGGIRRSLLFILGILGLGIVLYALAGFFGGPWLVDRWLEQYRAAGTERIASYERVRFNPFTLVGEIVALDMRDNDAGGAFSADRLIVDFAGRSLVERRPVIDSLAIERPRIAVASVGQLATLGRRARAAVPGPTRIDRIELAGGTFTAGAGTDRPAELARFDLSIAEFDGASGADAGFRFDAVTANQAGIAIDGTLAANLDRADGQLRLDAVDAGAAADWLGATVGAIELRGRADVTAELSATSLSTMPAIELTNASVELSELSLAAAAGLTVTSSPAGADGSFVLAAAGGGMDLSGRIEIDSVRLAIDDARVIPRQTFTFDDAAMLTTISADNEMLLSLGGRLGGAGDATLTMRVPSGAAGAIRVSIDTTNLPASMLSAYADDALGRRLAAGNADVGLEYSRDGNQVDGSLRIVTRDLAFSEPAADRAPGDSEPSLELAAALLEDAAGVIDMQLSFAGNTASVRDAVAAALEARIAAVTQTPFDTLAPIIGDPTANAVPFLPGDAALNDRAAAAIGALADALNSRPRLGVRVHGGYDPIVDRDALAEQQVELHVQLATAGTQDQARPAPVDFGSARARDVLDEFAGERLPAERVADLRDRYRCDGPLADVCERAYYESLFDALVANEAITPTALNRLGRFRALSVIDALGQRGIADDRIELVTGSNTVDTPFGIGLPIELIAAGLPSQGADD